MCLLFPAKHYHSKITFLIKTRHRIRNNKKKCKQNIFFSLLLIIISNLSCSHSLSPPPPYLFENDDGVGGSPSSSHSVKKHMRFSPSSHHRPQALILWERSGWWRVRGGVFTHSRRCTHKLKCVRSNVHTWMHTQTHTIPWCAMAV